MLAEKELQKLRFEAALNNIAEGLCIFDVEQKLVFCNLRYAEIYGLPSELTRPGTPHATIAGYRTGHGMHAAEGGVGFLERHEALLRLGEPSVERVELGDGRIIAIRHQPLVDGGWVATHHDITAEVGLARKLEEQNKRFDAALNNMRQGLCMFDREKRLVVSNRRYSEMYNIDLDNVRPGMTLDEILQQRLAAGNVPVGGGDAFVSNRLAVVADGQPASFVVEMVDGRAIAILHQPLQDGGWVATHEDVTEQRRNQARIQYLSRHDSLTDLANRTLFDEHLREVHGRLERGEMMAVLAIDLDHFKAVNDSLGHSIGDAVLKEVSRRLLDCTRETDIVCRLGGDEFALLQGRIKEPEDAALLARRIVRAIGEPFEVEGHRTIIGASIGIAVAPVDGRDGEALMKHADLALYRAKAEGRSCYHFYEHSLDRALQERRSMEAALRSALWQGELRLVFQPLLNLDGHRISCLEALLRWEHPTLGPLEPKAFVPLAEETGLIVPIGEWVLREACATAAKWPGNVAVAVNLSPVQFRKDRHLFDHVQSALSASGLDPHRLELEITESVLLADNAEALAILRRLKELGVKIAMDDFGTGYSSLSYLRRFPFDKIKIDQSFVHDASSNGESLAIIKAVIGLGHSLGITTTAEGVETEAQLKVIRDEGCTEVQGFLFSHPLPPGAVDELLGRMASGSGTESDVVPGLRPRRRRKIKQAKA